MSLTSDAMSHDESSSACGAGSLPAPS
jgi:hypothetical protein